MKVWVVVPSNKSGDEYEPLVFNHEPSRDKIIQVLKNNLNIGFKENEDMDHPFDDYLDSYTGPAEAEVMTIDYDNV